MRHRWASAHPQPNTFHPNQINHLHSPPIFATNLHPVTDPSYTVGLYKKSKLHVKYYKSDTLASTGSTIDKRKQPRTFAHPFRPCWVVPLIQAKFVAVFSRLRIIMGWAAE